MKQRVQKGQAANLEDVSRALKIVAKGGILVFASVLLEHVFTFARRLIIVRSLSTSDYGVYSLGISIVMLALVIAGMGIDVGVQRFVGIYRGRGDLEGVKGTVYSSVIVTIIAILVTTGLLMLSSGSISSLLDMPKLSWIIMVMALLIPLMRITTLIVNIYRGFEIVTPKVFFMCIGNGLITLTTVIVAVLVFDTLDSIVVALVIGNAISMAALIGYVLLRPTPLPKELKPRFEYRKLLIFSVPLIVGGFASQIMLQTDTVMLGYFTTAARVGVYNAAVPLYRVLSIFLVAVGFIYAPVAARMIGEKKHGELRVLYPSVTKWLFMFTMPAWFIFFFYPSETLQFFFGSRYVGAAFALQILALGEFVHTIVGPSGQTLIAYGKTYLSMFNIVTAAVLNVILNLVLIPRYGIGGAAIATAISLFAQNVLFSGQIYYYYRINPFTRDYIKPVVASLLVLVALYYPMKLVLGITIWVLPIYYIAFLACSLGMVVLTGSIDSTDLALYRAIKQRLLGSIPEKWLPERWKR